MRQKMSNEWIQIASPSTLLFKGKTLFTFPVCFYKKSKGRLHTKASRDLSD